MPHLICYLSLVALTLVVGCRKRRVETAPASPQGEAAASVAAGMPAAAAVPKDVPPDEALHFLNDAVRNYYAEKFRLPASLEEVYAAGYLKERYNPPPGRRFVLNPQTRAVELR